MPEGNNLQISFWIGLSFTLVAPIAIETSGGTIGFASLAAACGVFVTLASKIDDFAELSFGPLRARMREQLAQAAASIDQLRAIATTISAATLEDLIASQFIGGMRLSTRLKVHDRLIDALKKIEATKEQIEYVESRWRPGISVCYFNHIKTAIESAAQDMTAQGKIIDIQGYSSLFDVKAWAAPSPSDMESYCQKQGFSSTAITAWIDDYRHFIESGEIRRRELFEEE